MGPAHVYQYYDEPSFLHEEWTLYCVGMVIMLVRFAVRIRTVGSRGFRYDDYFMMAVIGPFSIDAAMVHIIYYAGTNVEANELATHRPLTSAEIAQFEYGSQNELLAWYSYTTLMFCLKGAMLCFLYRITYNTWHNTMVRWVGGICGVSYLPVMLTITFGCYPVYLNWQVSPNPEMHPEDAELLCITILNILTDGMILSIPIFMLWSLRISLKKKLGVMLLLSSGLFVITIALIRIIVTLTSSTSVLTINRWGVRETIVGIIAVNALVLRPLINKSFWTGRVSLPPVCTHRRCTQLRRNLKSTRFTSTGHSGPYEMASSVSVSGGQPTSTTVGDGSQQPVLCTLVAGEEEEGEGEVLPAVPAVAEGCHDVVVQRTYEVRSEPAESSDRDQQDNEVWMGHANTKTCLGSDAV